MKSRSGDDVTAPRELGFRMPAEWEPHAATWLAWPHEASDWPGKFAAIPPVFVEIARHLQAGERVRLLVEDARTQRQADKALRDGGVDLRRVDFYRIVTDRSWTRDFLPLIVVKPGGERAAVKWRFNGWARYRNWQKDDAAGERMAEELEVSCFRPEARVGRRHRRVVLEGGAVDVDGEGTLLATEECLLSGRQARNRELGRAGVEQALADYLGIECVIWLGSGIAGDDTAGHIDDFARFVRPGVVVLGEERDRRDANYRPLRQAAERLTGARDARGRSIEVVPLPMPGPLYYGRQRLPASYANFYVGNSAVLVPTFNDPRDRAALGILAELFPERTVVGIHCVDLVLGLGTLHCSTQQEPLGRRPGARRR
jgi:agmatine deiminase